MKPEQLCAIVRDTIAARGMDDYPSGPILAAVSGGADSLALMHVLHRLGYAVEVAHFDHRMREGSGKDVTFVRAQAAKLGLEVHAGVREEEPERGTSPEEGMRVARLAFLERTASQVGATRIATGHTRDDQAETVLMRLLAGAGRRGLAGIPPVRGPYIRPLIDAARADTEAFCKALRIKPLVDPTNADVALRRNAIRAELLPLLAARYNVRIAESLARTADVLRAEDSLLDRLTAEAIEPETGAGAVRLDAEHLASIDPALQRRAIRRIAALDAAHTERVRTLALRGKTGDEVSLPGGLNARLEYGWLVLGPAPSSPARFAATRLEVPGDTEIPVGASMRATAATSVPRPFPDGVSACAVDADAAGERLEVRPPKPGDRFRPLGMRSSKKLGDFFTDAKVPRAERATTPVVAGSKGIVWVVGHRIEERCKVTATTKRVLLLEWIPTRGGRA